ncbi:MAG: hypothetical protein HRT89_06615 [Lentisphaeria bacterium]|nr:hypothetical protein [Lentisphaeria bacterium]NQZ67726.1 hypothetical protein [Lentisphaeria bacterium]
MSENQSINWKSIRKKYTLWFLLPFVLLFAFYIYYLISTNNKKTFIFYLYWSVYNIYHFMNIRWLQKSLKKLGMPNRFLLLSMTSQIISYMGMTTALLLILVSGVLGV